MTSVPIMPLNVDKLFGDKKVQRLLRGGEAKAFWLWFLAQMWANKGWLPADDSILSDMLDIDVRRWRSKYKPVFEQLLVRDIEPFVGHIYRQERLTATWDDVANRIAKNKAVMADVRAAKAAKHGKAPSAPEPKNQPATEPATASATAPATGSNKNKDKKGELSPITRLGGSPFFAPTTDDTALPPRGVNGHAKPAPDASLGLEDRSLQEQVGDVETPEPMQPSPALLRSKLVNGGRRAKADDDAEPGRGRADQGGVSEPRSAVRTDAAAVGLFGALEAAIRKGNHEEER